MKAIKLSFSAPVHFGAGRLSDSRYSCDAATLFSALYIEALRMGVADELLEAAREGACMLSDAFPYIGQTMYLPKPLVQPDALKDGDCALPEAEDSRARKAAKKLAFIPSDRYARYLLGSLDPVSEVERFSLGSSSLRTKVNLERSRGEDAEPYSVGGFSFAPDAGLYVIVRGTYDLAPLLDQLSYAGLGGKRTSGYGRFAYSIEPYSLPDVPLCSSGLERRYVLLSTAFPAPDELDAALLDRAWYKIARKGGFVQSAAHSTRPQKKRDLYVFTAGSVFLRTFKGDVFDVNAIPGAHCVYRYARAMWMEV